MPIQLVCPKCSAKLNIPDAMQGKKGKCKCGAELTVPLRMRVERNRQAQHKQQPLLRLREDKLHRRRLPLLQDLQYLTT